MCSFCVSRDLYSADELTNFRKGYAQSALIVSKLSECVKVEIIKTTL